MNPKIFVALSFAAAAFSGPASAALSGFYDTAEQLQTIMGSSKVANALRQAPVGRIANTGTRKDGAKEWTLTTQDCDLVVWLKPQPPKGPGKTTYVVDAPKGCD